jgi:hypothetical protein
MVYKGATELDTSSEVYFPLLFLVLFLFFGPFLALFFRVRRRWCRRRVDHIVEVLDQRLHDFHDVHQLLHEIVCENHFVWETEGEDASLLVFSSRKNNLMQERLTPSKR